MVPLCEIIGVDVEIAFVCWAAILLTEEMKGNSFYVT